MVIWHHHHSFSWDIVRGYNKYVSLEHVKELSASGLKLDGLSCESAYAWTVIITITLIIKTPEKKQTERKISKGISEEKKYT